jgi:coatomer subunit beta
MSSTESGCYTIVFEGSSEYPSVQDLRSALERGSDEVKIETLRKILVQAINGNPQVSWTRSVSLAHI